MSLSTDRDYIGFTCDVRKFVNVLAQDPTVRDEIVAGLCDTPLPLTTALGAANLSAQEGVEPTWCSLFPATVQGKGSGEAFCYRNDSRGGKGDRIQLRLRKQPKRQQRADDGQASQVNATRLGDTLPQGIDANMVMEFLRQAKAAGASQPNAAAPASAPVPPAQVQNSAAASIPPDIAKRLGIGIL